MQRKGECNNCGWCCQFEGVHRNVVLPSNGSNVVSESDRKFYELRGGKTAEGGKIVRYLMYAYAPCSAHDATKRTCTIYGQRPDICRDFPSTPEQIEGTPCSYWFEEDVDGVIIRRGGRDSLFPTSPTFKV